MRKPWPAKRPRVQIGAESIVEEPTTEVEEPSEEVAETKKPALAKRERKRLGAELVQTETYEEEPIEEPEE